MDNKFVLSQSFNDIVFENRNKKYGAYEIRRKYMRYTLLAGAAAVLFFTCGTFTWAYVQEPERIVTTVDIPIDITPPVDPYKPKDPDPVKPKEIIDVPEQPAGGKVAIAITAQIDIVPEDSMTPPSNIVVDNGAQGPVGPTQGGGGGGDCINCPKVDSTPYTPPVIYDWTMYPPENDGLDIFITKNIHYPDMCRELGIEGTVYVEFIVDQQGGYRDVKAVKGPHAALNKEAVRVMSIMPTWKPARDEKGNVVEYRMRKPIRFSLTK